MNAFDGRDVAEKLLPHRVVRKLATAVSLVMILALWSEPERTTA